MRRIGDEGAERGVNFIVGRPSHLRQSAAVRRKVKRSAQTGSQMGSGAWPPACGPRRCRGVSSRPRHQYVSESGGAMRDSPILVRRPGPQKAPTLEPRRVREGLRGLLMLNRFARLKPIRPRPLSCRMEHQASLAEFLLPVPPVVLRPPGCRRTVHGGSRSPAALRRPSGLKVHFASNAREGRPAIYGFADLSRTRPSLFILRSAC